MAKKSAKGKKSSSKKVNLVSEKLGTQWSLNEIELMTEKVKSSKGSGFTKEDVINLLSELRNGIKERVKQSQDFDVRSLVDDITLNICGSIDENDFEELEFNLNQNTIELDSFQLDENRIKEYVEDSVNGFFEV